MYNIMKAMNIANRGIRKWSANPRIYILAALVLLFIHSYTMPILDFSGRVGVNVAPYLFPFFASDFHMQSIFMLGVILLFCDAPFIDDSEPYVIIRSGRYVWASGQVIYIAWSSLIYVLFLVTASFLFLLPSAYISDGWGKAIGTLSLTDAAVQFNIPLMMSPRIVHLYTPIQAMALSFILTWMMSAIIGLLMFVLNSYINRAAGAIAACGMVMFNYFIYNLLPQQWYSFSPISLSNIGLLNNPEMSDIMTPRYALITLSACIAILIFLSVLSVRKRKIEVLQHL
jgi:hypothetical protein